MNDSTLIKKIEEKIRNFLPAQANISFLAHAFYDFFLILKTYNENVNLVSDSSYEEFLFRHVLDSLSVFKACKFVDLSGNKLLIDIGSGAGFPGFPIKLLNPTIRLISVESISKKADFQIKLVEELKLDSVVVENNRAEALARTELRGTADIVVSRALSTIPILTELSLPYLKIGGKAVFYKSTSIQEEISASENAFSQCGGKLISIFNYQIRQSDPQRKLIIIEKIEETSSKYPRRIGIPFKRPL